MNKLKQNRAVSFIVVTLVYIIATVVGVLAYRALTLDWWLSLLIADAAATVATFIFSVCRSHRMVMFSVGMCIETTLWKL